MGLMSVGGPDLGPIEYPPVAVMHGAAAHTGKVGSHIGFAHADTEEKFSPADLRQKKLLFLLRAEAQKQRAALPVGDPVPGNGGACRQQFLHPPKPPDRTAYAPPASPPHRPPPPPL